MNNQILSGDCLYELEKIKPQSVDLIYLDPPFFTEKKHKLKNIERTKEFSFDDTWGTNIAYASFLELRITKMKTVLKETGSIFVHCDKSGEHIVRTILDKIFGAENFQSEIIWSYKRWSNSKKGLLPNHQNIYFYSKSKNFKFNKFFNDYSETTNVDQILQNRERDKHNKSVYARDTEGNVILGKEKKGVPLSDVWEIPYLNPKAKERVGYPTQKPLLLLEQIIKLVTEPDDLVLDPFCGSGTTCVAANLLHRDYIGIDVADAAVELTKKRLQKPIRTYSEVLNNGREAYKNADTEALKLLKGVKYNVVQRNKGIDAILVEHYENSPVLIRIQKGTETVSEGLESLAKAMKVKGSKKSIFIQTTNYEQLLAFDRFENITIIKSPALSIQEEIA